MAVITVERKNGAVAFDPPTLTINQGDVVVFRNLDPEQAHLITKYVAPPGPLNPTFWFPYAMAPFVAPPGDTSDEVFFAITKDPAPPLTVTYVGSEYETPTGTIVVVDPRYK